MDWLSWYLIAIGAAYTFMLGYFAGALWALQKRR